MRCPYCAADNDRVLDSRPTDEGAAIRRRRECQGCGQRFSTYERAEQAPVAVVKRSGVVEPFDHDKLRAGIEQATAGLPVSADEVRRAVAAIEARIRGLGRREVASELIGSEVRAALRSMNTAAYIRFASVYKGFTSAEDFARELAALEGSAES